MENNVGTNQLDIREAGKDRVLQNITDSESLICMVSEAILPLDYLNGNVLCKI